MDKVRTKIVENSQKKAGLKRFTFENSPFRPSFSKRKAKLFK